MKFIRIAAAGAFALLATACLLAPGKFDASLDIRRDGSFTYRYAGEVVFITPAAAAEAQAEADKTYDPSMETCWDDQQPPAQAKERPCTQKEMEQAKSDWEANRAMSAERRKTEVEQMKAVFGGLDPSDPKAVDQFTQRLLSYDGWKRVTHKGKGVFDVLYEKSGRLDHDFIFPLFPEVDWIIPFVHASRRSDSRIRVAAPAFAQAKAMGGGMNGLGAFGAMAGEKAGPLPKPEGTFTLTTDAEVLTNNTNDGPVAGAGGTKTMKWVIGPLDSKKPEALLKL
ncbi:MAG TPA: hypothetical protein VGB70_12975 [Allosphingosinicella sp.]|jgi:hypothetical protein